MLKNEVFQAIEKSELPEGAKVIDSTWACKKKSNGFLRSRLNAKGFKQVEGQHYDRTYIHAPVTNATTMYIVLTLMLMGDGWQWWWMSRELSCMESFIMERKYI